MNAPGALRHSAGHRAAQKMQAAVKAAKMREITSRLLGKSLGTPFANLDPRMTKAWSVAMINELKKQSFVEKWLQAREPGQIVPMDQHKDPFQLVPPSFKPMGLYDPKHGAIACKTSV